jgi:hypothetical protein
MPVTRPVAETVASAVLDDVHVAELVTSSVVPSSIVAIAVNCAVAPTAGAVPATATDETVEAVVVELPHAIAKTASTAATAIELIDRTRISFLL